MEILTIVGLFAAAVAAGAINAVAGGGSLVSFPALITAGYSSKAANVTNSVALWPGYLGGSLGYRAELMTQRRRVITLSVPSVLGALAGSVILLATPDAAFDLVAPLLILFACALMAVQDRIAAAVQRRRSQIDEERLPATLIASVFVLGGYGAYFGGGLGILTLAVLTILLPDDLQRSNALKGILSLVINAVAVVLFAAFGPVHWGPAAIMAIGALAGGYGGVGVARRLGRERLRIAVIAYGTGMALILLIR